MGVFLSQVCAILGVYFMGASLSRHLHFTALYLIEAAGINLISVHLRVAPCSERGPRGHVSVRIARYSRIYALPTSHISSPFLLLPFGMNRFSS
jgi:hypothetical protein